VESGRILRWRLWEVKEFTAEEGNVHHEEEGTVDRMNKMDRIEKRGASPLAEEKAFNETSCKSCSSCPKNLFRVTSSSGQGSV